VECLLLEELIYSFLYQPDVFGRNFSAMWQLSVKIFC